MLYPQFYTGTTGITETQGRPGKNSGARDGTGTQYGVHPDGDGSFGQRAIS